MNITQFSLWMLAGIERRASIVAYDTINLLQKLNIVTMFQQNSVDYCWKIMIFVNIFRSFQ